MLAEPFRHQKPIEKLIDPISDQSMVVSLDQLKTYEHNPRRTRNPKYDEIKQSILSRGLDQPPPITKSQEKATILFVMVVIRASLS